MKEIKRVFAEYFAILDNQPNIIKDYADYIEHHTAMTNNNKNLELQKIEIENMQGLLKRLEGSIKPEYNGDLEYIKNQYSKLQVELAKASEIIKAKKPEMMTNIDREMDTVKKYIKQYESNLMKDKFVEETCAPADVLKELNELKRNIDKQRDKNDYFTKIRKLMDLTTPPNKDLADLEMKYNDRKLLWTHVDKLLKCHEDWYKTNIRMLDSEDIQKEMQQFDSTVMQLKLRINNLSQDGKDKVLEVHEARIRKIAGLMPIISSLANRDLKDKHWKKIFDKLEQPMPANKSVSLT